MKEIRSRLAKFQCDGEEAPLESGDFDESVVQGEIQDFEYGEIHQGIAWRTFK